MVGNGDGIAGAAPEGICVARLQRERTSDAKIVDASLLQTDWF
jgi:hypothetical protein